MVVVITTIARLYRKNVRGTGKQKFKDTYTVIKKTLTESKTANFV